MTAEDQMPRRLGPYSLLGRLGEGGMGVVFLARDASGQTVALKVLRSVVAEDPLARRRLAREVETMRRVRSPYVAEVIDADLAGDTPYIVTRYVPGRTLDQVVNEGGPLPPSALLRPALQYLFPPPERRLRARQRLCGRGRGYDARSHRRRVS